MTRLTKVTKCRFVTHHPDPQHFFLGVEDFFSVSKINQTDRILVKRRGEEMSTAGTSGQQRCRFGKRYAQKCKSGRDEMRRDRSCTWNTC
jgi:hypothetical protein